MRSENVNGSGQISHWPKFIRYNKEKSEDCISPRGSVSASHTSLSLFSIRLWDFPWKSKVLLNLNVAIGSTKMRLSQ